ncbi:MAG: ABC transporter ATP-binding protein [Phycisphaerae bacterium]
MSSTLSAESISKSFPTRSGSLDVLRDVSLTLDAGESAAVMGPSGSGKSTLLNILGTLEAPSAGRVSIENTDPFALSERELARFRNRRVGFVFQEHHLLPQCSVLENILLPTLAGHGEADGLDRARRLIDRVGLSERLEHRPAELSGGERQRVAIARALINSPAVVLADEPTGNLDGRTAASIAKLLLEVYQDEGAVLVVVTHSKDLAEQIGALMRLEDGALVRV